MKELIVDALAAKLGDQLAREEILRAIEVPPDEKLGDFAFPCFPLARVFRKSPISIAEDLAASLKDVPGISEASAVKGYLNIYVDKRLMAEKLLGDIAASSYGRDTLGQQVVVEFASPNTNKPLHLGHLRNISIGESVSRILEFCGNHVTRTCVNNDRGVHICQSMLAYQAWGEGATPESTGRKSDHFVGDYYVRFSTKAKQDASLKKQAQAMLRAWEDGDPEVRLLWERMNGWALAGFEATYRLFGISFDKQYYESQLYTKGKEIVHDGLARSIFYRLDNGAVAVNLEDEKLGEKVLLRSDGTAVYIVQDLYLAGLKNTEFNFDRSIYVVGNEQDYHFKVLVAIFRRLGFPIADKIHHLSYGMVELPEGRMKSREGTVVDADDIVSDTKELAREEVAGRYELAGDELDERSLRIALAALKYTLLKIDTGKNMVFNPKQAISFEGDTGPYLLYSYARASSILRKLDSEPRIEIGEPDDYEARLVKQLARFPTVVRSAQDRLMPSLVAGYAFVLAQVFNEFYHACPVLKSDKAGFRIALVRGFRTVLKDCINLLGIDEIEEM